jgi:cytochrome c oxidase subunit 2
MDWPMHILRRVFATLLLATATIGGLAGTALAQVPRNWELGMQAAGSPVQQQIESLNDIVMVIITVITLLVAALLVWVMIRYNAKRNPTPSQVSHHTGLEIAWTVIPVLILVGIAIPSFRLVFYEDRTQNADLTIKVTGHQWYWEYAYPDNGPLDFTSYEVQDADLKAGQLRKLSANNPLVLPVGKNVRILTTSGDVIHSFFIPSLGVQRYAIPGQTIETWVRVDRPGDYYGECNQICGANHSNMPIMIHAIPADQFNAWVAQAKTKFAEADPPARAWPSVSGGPIAVAELQH